MVQAVLHVATWIAAAHDRWISRLARRRLSGEVARLALRGERLAAENALLTRWDVRSRYGAVARRGSIALIEPRWRAFKHEYARHLFLHVSEDVLHGQLLRWARLHNAERPHQGLGQRTPDEVYRRKVPKDVRPLTAGVLPVRFLEGDPRLPVLRLARAA